MPSVPYILADLIKHLTGYRHSRKTDLISVENLLSTVYGIPSVPPSPPLGLGAHSCRRLLRGLEEPSWLLTISAGSSAILDCLAGKAAMLARFSNL